MSPSRRPFRVMSLGCLLIISLLLSVLPVSWPGQPAAHDAAAADIATGSNVADAARSLGDQEARPFETNWQPAPGVPQALQAAETTYYVEWNITASGFSLVQGSDWSRYSQRRILIDGTAVVHVSAGGDHKAFPMKLTITDDSYQNWKHACWSCGCVDEHDWISITDPARYLGGPDPFWDQSGQFRPRKKLDGTWYMNNPFSDWEGFAYDGLLHRDYNYRHDEKDIDECRGEEDTSTSTSEMMDYFSLLPPLRDMPLIGDSTGTVFKLSTEYPVQISGVPLKVSFGATVVVGACSGMAAPIDIANPTLKFVDVNLEAEDTTPDGEATVQARVTCEGVPVQNAPVVLKLKAVERSGGHNHSDSKRPRGYIDGIEQNANTKFIGITDSDGAVSFTINPGRDLTDKSRGIAGLYSADATVEWEGLTSTTARATIDAHLDLVNLPESDKLYWRLGIPEVHPKEFYGTPATVQRVQQLARDWWNTQVLHDVELASMGEEPWGVRALVIWGISLPQGGLYDQRAYLPGQMWRTPFRQHRFGQDVAFAPPVTKITPPEMALWFKREFRMVGNKYGTWFSDPVTPYHVRITNAGANLPESSMSALGKSFGTDPDVAASATLVNPAERYVAGAGQAVTYAVGVENVVTGTVASQVELKAALPEGLNFISANPVQSRMQDPRTPVWEIGSLPGEGAPRPFEVNAQVDPSVAAGAVLTVTATATTSSPDADPANNPFSDWGLTVQQPGPDLVIGSNLNATALVVREPVTFTLLLSNEGNAPASNSWFSLTAPIGITITKTSPTASVIPGGVRWDTGVVTPGEELTATVDLQVDPGLLDLAALSSNLEPEYPLSFTMTAGSDDSDIDPASNQMQVDKRVELRGPDLQVALQTEGTPGPGLFKVGQEVTYTLRYANTGNQEAGEVSAALLLWPGLTPIESQPAPTTNQLDTTTGVRTLTWTLGECSVGEEGAIELRLQVDDVPEAGSIIQANISSDTIDVNAADNVVMETRYEASNAGRYKMYLPLVTRG